jgi:hypothetical protein
MLDTKKLRVEIVYEGTLTPSLQGDRAGERRTGKAVDLKQRNDLESAPGGNRTPDPQIRSLMLYPTELQARQGRRTMRIGFYHRVGAVVGLANAESLA